MSKQVSRGLLRARHTPLSELPASELPVLFADHVHLSQRAADAFRDRVFTLTRTFWLFLSQVFSADGSCQEAVMKALAWVALEQDEEISSNTSAFCQARDRLPVTTLRATGASLRRRLDRESADTGLWCGRTVKVVDGSSVAMPDTPGNQKAYPQPKGQKAGCGFPVARLVCMFSLATGALLAYAQASLKISERALWRRIWKNLCEGDVALSDRGLCSFAEFGLLLGQGVDSVARLHSRRGAGVKVIERLGRKDQLVEWLKGDARPRWVTKKQWLAMPDTLTLRHVTFAVTIDGFRPKKITVATTLLDSKRYRASALADLFRRRWMAELFLRDIKTTLGMEMLRCKSPEMIRKEIEMHFIAYNLVRALMLEAARVQNKKLDRMSFKQSLSLIRQWAPMLAAAPDEKEQTRLMRLLLHYVAFAVVPLRQNRAEPRALKRRPKNYQLLNKPRKEFHEIMHRNRYKKGLS